MSHRYLTLDVFTDRAFGGNPLAVFPEAQGLTGEQMQRLAKELNLSETVFVLPPRNPDHAARVRIFTPGSELPFAGHPTVGTAFALAHLGRFDLRGPTTTIVLEEGVGPVPVRIAVEDGSPGSCELTAAVRPSFAEMPGIETIAEILEVPTESVRRDALAPIAASCGIAFGYVALDSVEAVRAAGFRAGALQRECDQRGLVGMFVYAMGGEIEGSDVHARMFAPSVGVPEDPATGSAATALAAVLARAGLAGEGSTRWQVEQGIEMGRPSLMSIEAVVESGEVTATRVAGRSVLVSEGRFFVP